MGQKQWARALAELRASSKALKQAVRGGSAADAVMIQLVAVATKQTALQNARDLQRVARRVEHRNLALAAALQETGKVDAMGDLTQLMQVRLQKYLDAYTKTFEMLSNVLKKLACSAEAIVGNMK